MGIGAGIDVQRNPNPNLPPDLQNESVVDDNNAGRGTLRTSDLRSFHAERAKKSQDFAENVYRDFTLTRPCFPGDSDINAACFY